MSTGTNLGWAEECQHISNVAEVFKGTRAPDEAHNLANYNYDRDVFIRYCRMQAKAAHRAGRHDSVTYIEQVIDDMKEVTA